MNGTRTIFPASNTYNILRPPICALESQLIHWRPEIEGHKLYRAMKDLVYIRMAGHLDEFKIDGSYIGLAAAYTPEIYEVFSQHVKGTFVNCNFKETDYQELLTYQTVVSTALRNKPVEFILHHGDILEEIYNSTEPFSIIDMDFMFMLNQDNIETTCKAISDNAADRATIAIWHSSNRFKDKGHKVTNGMYRPYIHFTLSQDFKILKYDQIDYYEGYPMHCDVYTLERAA